jgi:hypothetical protein
MQEHEHASPRSNGVTHPAAAPRRDLNLTDARMRPGPADPAPARDHILILGRRGAGKSVFLARLYERLWNSKGDIHMAAVDGQAHVALLSRIDQMGKRRWPEPTKSFSSLGFDVTYHGERLRLSATDYSGELLHRAFMGGDRRDPDVQQLLDSIDRAAAVIVLVDPQVALEGDIETRSEQDFGLVAAVKRIRESPDGEFVPVAITLTKCDLYRDDIESTGGPGKYMRKHYKNLCRAVFRKGSKGTVFACAAVRTRKDDTGKPVPDMARSPRGLVEPLEYCLESLHRHRELAEELRQRGALAAEASAAAMRAQKAEQRATRFSNAVLVGSLGLAAAVIGVLVWVVAGTGR